MAITRPIRLTYLPLLLALLFSALSLGCAANPVDSATNHGFYRSGAVAADHFAASEAGAEMLRAGGNAVDAAVATSFALSVVRPYSCGIGGGGFMVIHLADGRAEGPEGRQVALDYRETAPASTTPDLYEKLPEGASTRGVYAVATPGTVAGLLYALEKYGTMGRAEVLAPAIRLAEEGFEVDAHYVESVRPLIRRFREHPREQERFSFVWERFLLRGEVKVGDRIRLPEQAEALRLIARDGAPAFYEGPIGEAIVRALEEDRGQHGGGRAWMMREDLGSYWIKERSPLVFEYAGQRFVTMPPPSSGGVVMAQTLGIYAQLGGGRAALGGAGLGGWDAGRVHMLVEALKHAFADRAVWLGDPDHVADGAGTIRRLLSGSYLRDRAALFDPSRTLAADSYGTRETGAAGVLLPDDSGTSHLSVVDRWGNAVACTETINLTFGSLVAVEEYGFILNNEMDDFTARRGEANAFGLRQSDRNLPMPRKRPLSSMTPTIVLDEEGRVQVVAGGAGGPRIITATLQVILHALDGADAAAAAQASRLHHQWIPERLQMEAGLAAAPVSEGTTMAEAMEGRGHRVEEAEALANVQVIVRERDRRAGWKWTAASDPRKGGRPAGH